MNARRGRLKQLTVADGITTPSVLDHFDELHRALEDARRPTEVEIVYFVEESNRIEGILRNPTESEIEEFKRFIALDKVTVADMEHFVKVYQPGARMRDQVGMNVQVGDHFTPQPGCPEIRERLKKLLAKNIGAYKQHIAYETLHPFTDGNGRSGRALWAWNMGTFPLGFLHKFYYQTLSATR